MSERTYARKLSHRIEATDCRRRQLRALLLTAADAARQSRRVDVNGLRERQYGSAVRDRVSMLLSAAN